MNADNADAEKECLICKGPDKKDQELLSGCCSCRGSSGRVHSHCLVKNAQYKTKAVAERFGIERVDEDIYNIWMECFTCKQDWTGATAASMGTECAAFICKEFPDEEELKIAALGVKCIGLSALGSSSKECAACDDVLSAIEIYQSATQGSVIPPLILTEKSAALCHKGQISLEKNDPANAVEYFEKSKGTLLQMGHTSDDTEMLKVDVLIAEAKANLPGVDKKEALENLLKQQKRLFTVCKDKLFGEDDRETYLVGFELSHTLIELKRFDEAKHLLRSLYLKSCQVHGRGHPNTKDIEEMILQWFLIKFQPIMLHEPSCNVVSKAMSNNSAS